MTLIPHLSKQPFNKPWCSYKDQVALLQQRGLAIADPAAAADFLSHINYYRFSGCCLAFEQARHQFHLNVTFEQIKAAYDFDRKLRDLLAEALELAELDWRTAIAYEFGYRHGAFGHIDPVKFFHRFRHQIWIDKLRDEADRSKELFISHFRATYKEFPDLPIWIVTEVMSFGALSQMYQGMTRQDQKVVSARYGLQPSDLASWMHHLVYIRNLCAHHSRIWDRIWSIKPNLPAGKAWRPPVLPGPGNNRLFVTILILGSLLKKCPTMSVFTIEWRHRVEALLANPPAAINALALMGLPANWQAHPCWN